MNMLVTDALKQLDLPQPIAIIGAGVTGVSFYQLLEQSDVICDVFNESEKKHDFFEGKSSNLIIGELTQHQLNAYGTLLISPGVDLRRNCFEGLHPKVISDIDLFARLVNKLRVKNDKQIQLIGITASNGKSTVADMLHHVSTYTEKQYILCGNIGVAVLSALLEYQMNCDGYIIELSSYHLDSTPFLELDFGIWLNVSPDHLDRYNGYIDYVQSKSRVFTQAKCAIGNADDKQVTSYAEQHKNYQLFSLKNDQINWHISNNSIYLNDQLMCDLSEFSCTGYHLANKLSVFVIAYQLGFSKENILKGYETYQSLPSRFITVAEKKGVRFINDSKATNVGSVVAAIDCIDTPIILIAGGLAKNQDFTPLLKAAKNKVKYIALIGQDASHIAGVFENIITCKKLETLKSAFDYCIDVAEVGDTILLSPACASQDMFINYLERGKMFEQLVKDYI